VRSEMRNRAPLPCLRFSSTHRGTPRARLNSQRQVKHNTKLEKVFIAYASKTGVDRRTVRCGRGRVPAGPGCCSVAFTCWPGGVRMGGLGCAPRVFLVYVLEGGREAACERRGRGMCMCACVCVCVCVCACVCVGRVTSRAKQSHRYELGGSRATHARQCRHPPAPVLQGCHPPPRQRTHATTLTCTFHQKHSTHACKLTHASTHSIHPPPPLTHKTHTHAHTHTHIRTRAHTDTHTHTWATNGCRFLFDGIPIKSETTPIELNMEDGGCRSAGPG
jgi:hypothetical protein